MKKKVRFWGLDVHAETIAVAIAEPDGSVRSLGTIPNGAYITENVQLLLVVSTHSYFSPAFVGRTLEIRNIGRGCP